MMNRPIQTRSYAVAFYNRRSGLSNEVVVDVPSHSMGNGVKAAVTDARMLLATLILGPDKPERADHQDALARLIEDLEPTGVCKAGEARQFYVSCVQRGELFDTEWSELIAAVDEEDARFSALWLMAEERGHSIARDTLDGFLKQMALGRIVSVAEVPCTLSEAFNRLRGLYEAVRDIHAAPQDLQRAMTDARQVLTAFLGCDPDDLHARTARDAQALFGPHDDFGPVSRHGYGS
jgi:hypothetical protein